MEDGRRGGKEKRAEGMWEGWENKEGEWRREEICCNPWLHIEVPPGLA